MNGEGASICSLLHLGESASGKGEQGLGAVRNLNQDPGFALCDLGQVTAPLSLRFLIGKMEIITILLGVLTCLFIYIFSTCSPFPLKVLFCFFFDVKSLLNLIQYCFRFFLSYLFIFSTGPRAQGLSSWSTEAQWPWLPVPKTEAQ